MDKVVAGNLLSPAVQCSYGSTWLTFKHTKFISALASYSWQYQSRNVLFSIIAAFFSTEACLLTFTLNKFYLM